jgi:hypothetical protein
MAYTGNKQMYRHEPDIPVYVGSDNYNTSYDTYSQYNNTSSSVYSPFTPLSTNASTYSQRQEHQQAGNYNPPPTAISPELITVDASNRPVFSSSSNNDYFGYEQQQQQPTTNGSVTQDNDDDRPVTTTTQPDTYNAITTTPHTTTNYDDYDDYATPTIPPPPDFRRMKQRRVRAQLAAGTVGAVAGFVALGPLGAIVGGVAGNKLTKAVGKRRETVVQTKYFNRVAAAAAAPNHTATHTNEQQSAPRWTAAEWT